MDPMAEKYTESSPYCYALNNPLKYIDAFGLEIKNAYEYERNTIEKQEKQQNWKKLSI